MSMDPSTVCLSAHPFKQELSKTWAYSTFAQLMNEKILIPHCVKYLENWRLRNTTLHLSHMRKAIAAKGC